MKLFKVVASFLLLVVVFTAGGCATKTCSEADVVNIKAGLMTVLEEGTGEGAYATPEDWVDLSEAEKVEYVDKLYKNKHPKACLAFSESVDEISGAVISKKNWSYAFSKKNGGLIEGLFVFPISWLIASISGVLGHNGFSQLLAIIVVTFLVRFIVILATFKSTVQSQKIQMLQPQLNAINQKYADRNDAQAKNQKAMEIMNIYKKNGINPLSSLISPFATLPVFLAIYGAVSSTLVLREGHVFGVALGSPLKDGVLSYNVFAIILIVLMVGSQYISMKIATWISKKKMQDSHRPVDPRLQKNPANTMTYVFMIMIVVIGWVLPISMTVYWIASSLFTIVQTYAMRNVASNVVIK